jgi:hypothetical protein
MLKGVSMSSPRIFCLYYIVSQCLAVRYHKQDRGTSQDGEVLLLVSLPQPHRLKYLHQAYRGSESFLQVLSHNAIICVAEVGRLTVPGCESLPDDASSVSLMGIETCFGAGCHILLLDLMWLFACVLCFEL